MISILNVSKSFSDVQAINHINLNIMENSVFGLLGTNGAGKSTLLRMMSGVLKADEGKILVDGKEVYDNPEIKANIFYISDDQYFFPNATPKDMAKFYQSVYPEFNMERFNEFLEKFDLKKDRKIRTFSKGMKKQLSIILGICANTKYIFCDETFDGLDPVVRQGTKGIFIQEMEERGLIPVIASHNLRELEDLCDRVGVLHEGGILLAEDLDELKLNICKVQCVLSEDFQVPESFQGNMKEYLDKMFDIVKFEQRGRMFSMTIRANEKEVISKMEILSPIYLETLPLTLEEIFICETEVTGYDFKKLLL